MNTQRLFFMIFVLLSLFCMLHYECKSSATLVEPLKKLRLKKITKGISSTANKAVSGAGSVASQAVSGAGSIASQAVSGAGSIAEDIINVFDFGAIGSLIKNMLKGLNKISTSVTSLGNKMKQ
jgi:hypothetical protein